MPDSTPHKPDKKSRAFVKAMVVGCYSQGEIARIIDIDEKTLRKHYRLELDQGLAEVSAAVSNKLAQKAMAGDTPSMIWFEKTRRGMKDTQKVETVQTVKRINLTGTDENSKPKRPQK